MTEPESTIQALRRDIALQVSKAIARAGEVQTLAARRLGIPQPTLSKIMNGHVHDLSIELLLRIAMRAGLTLTLQTGRDSKEAGAFVSRISRGDKAATGSELAEEARSSLTDSEKRLTPSQRLEAFLEHNQLAAELRKVGDAVRQQSRGRAIAS